MPTAAEVIEVAAALRDDFLAGRVDGMETLQDQGRTAMIEYLTQWIDEAKTGPISAPLLESIRALSGSHARSFSGDPWEKRGGSHRFLVVAG